MPTVSFKATRAEHDLVEKIIKRAERHGLCCGKREPDHWYTRDTMRMDLIATNANGCPMDFERLLAADGLNFVHDIAGIARHMDRTTGKLGNCFTPRLAKRNAAVA